MASRDLVPSVHLPCALFPPVQFVVTTHSAVIAHETHPGELVLLRRRRTGLLLTRQTVDAARLSLPQLLESPLFGLPTMESHHRRQERRRQRGQEATGTLPRGASTAERRDKLLRRIQRHLAAGSRS